MIAVVRRHIAVPLALGFGLSTPKHVEIVAAIADAAVIGSKIIKLIDEAEDNTPSRCAKVKEFCQAIRPKTEKR